MASASMVSPACFIFTMGSEREFVPTACPSPSLLVVRPAQVRGQDKPIQLMINAEAFLEGTTSTSVLKLTRRGLCI